MLHVCCYIIHDVMYSACKNALCVNMLIISVEKINMLLGVFVLASKVYEGRILRRVAVEAVKYGKGSWMQKMLSCCREFGWQEVGAEQVQNMSEAELKGMLESVAWWGVRAE